MSPGRIFALVLAALIAIGALLRRRRLGVERFALALLAAAALTVYGSHVLAHVDIQKGIENLANALGKWTYALVGVIAFLETGAFVGLIAPGEFTILLGGVIAGQGEIDIWVLIPLVWACTFAGDSVSFFLGKRLGRNFLIKHGPKVRITPERLEQVDEHFRRRGGATVLVGRFIGFVRPIAPFIAGTSPMRYRQFAPYSIVGTGIWGPGLCVIGYVSYRSFSKVSKIAGQATLIFGLTVALIVGIVYARNRLKDPEERARLAAWLERQGERPLLRPLAKVLRPLWRRVLRPAWMFAAPRLRFLWQRLTPGGLGIEFTSAVAVASVGLYAFVALAVTLASHPGPTPADNAFLDLADDTRANGLVDVVKVLTQTGSLPVVGLFMLVSVVMLARRRRPVELTVLLLGFLLVILAVHLTKAGVDRARPSGSLVNTLGSAYPSGHTAYSTAYVAMAVIAARVFRGLGSRVSLVLVAILVSAAVGASRMYLRAHYWSDVVGGWGVGFGIFALGAAVALVVVHLRNTWQAERV
jgi:membrane protein DedA with SNARE-associated domain/membrane-associated phospholipid phosphatase